MVIYSVMQSVEWFCSFLSNSSMLLEKSNNYSGTLLFHAAGIVDLWYAPSGCPFCRASLQRYYNADKYNRHNHEHCHVTIQKCPYVTAKQRFYTFLPNKQKPPFVPNSTKSGFLSSYFRNKEPCGSLFRQVLFVLQRVPDVLNVIVILQRIQQLAHQLQLIGVDQTGGGHGHHGQIIGQDLVALLL